MARRRRGQKENGDGLETDFDLTDSPPNAIISLNLLRGYKLAWLPNDLITGLIIFAVTIPCAVAYSNLAGLPPINGLYASLAAMVIYPLLATSRHTIVDAEDTVAILVGTTLPILAAGGPPERYLALAMMMAMLVGVILLIGGMFRLGFIADFMPKTIISGFLNGMALIIIASQLAQFTGVKLEHTDFFPRLWEFYTKIHQVNHLILIMGLACLGGLLLISFLSPKIPGPIPVTILATVAVVWWDLGAQGIKLIGTVPGGLPNLMLPDVGFKDIMNLLPLSAGIALIAYFDVMSTAKGFAFKNRYQIDSSQEMLALGAANLGSGLFQGFGCGCSQSRTAINNVYGGKSQIAQLTAAGLLALFLINYTYVLKNVPVTALTAIVVMAGINLFEPWEVYKAWRTRPPSAYLSLATTFAVLIGGLMIGILMAVVLAIILALQRLTRPHEIVTRPPVATGLLIYRFGAPLFFFNANYFATRVHELISSARPQVTFLLINAEAIVDMDVTASEMLEELYSDLKSRGIILGMCGVKGHFRKVLSSSGLPKRAGFHIYPKVEEAVRELTKKSEEEKSESSDEPGAES